MNFNKCTNNTSQQNCDCNPCWLNKLPAQTANSLSNSSKTKSLDRLKSFKKGSVIIKAGDTVTGVYCIKNGSVKVSKKNSKNNEFILWIAGEEDVVGIHSFINNEPFSFSATAMEDVNACFISASELNMLMQSDPIVFLKTIDKLCEKLNFIEQRITSISGKKMRGQCAEMLISVATRSNLEYDKRFYINYSINDLAGLIGTTKNYLYKILLEFTNKEILSVHNRKFAIKDMGALTSIAMGDEK